MSKEKKSKQLELRLRQPLFNSLAKIKERFELSRARWDIKKYTKSTWVWFTIVLTLFLIATQLLTIQENIVILPRQIPLLKIYIEAEKALVHVDYIYLIPGVSFLIFLMGIILSNSFYNKQRSLSNTVLWVMFLGTLVVTISLIRLINLF